MNTRRGSHDEALSGSFGGRVALAAAVLFALGATGVLILTDEQRWLRLGIVAALWAALAGAFVAARYRRQVADQEEALAERQERYELELEREIAARREYELEVAAEARRKADEASRDDIAALRQELFGLRQTLEGLLGGEFLVERYALRAESTRMRPLGDDRQLKRLPPATFTDGTVVPSVPREPQTELIERVRAAQDPKHTAEPPLPRRADGTHPAELSDRWFVPDGLGTDQPAAESQPYGARRYAQQRTQFMANVTEPDPARAKKANRDKGSSGTEQRRAQGEPAAYGQRGGGYADPATGGYAQPAVGQETNGIGGYVSPAARGESGGFGPSGYRPPTGSGEGFGPSAGGAGPGFGSPGGRGERPNHGSQAGQAESAGYASPVGRAAESSGYVPPVSRAESSGHASPVRRVESSGHVSPVSRAESSGYVSPVSRAESSNQVSPAGRAETSGYFSPAGRAESSGYFEPAAGSSGYRQPVGRPETSPNGWASGYHQPARQEPGTGGGRRRRAEGQPTWQESRQNTAAGTDNGPTGSHAAGRSVSELLASHGGTPTPTPRRRRRKE